MCLCGKYIQYRNQRLLSDTGESSIFDEYMDADRLTDEERAGVLVVFGAFDSNVLCGVCGMTNEGHITMLYVHPQYLRRGIGKKLLERVRIYARMQLKLMQVSVNAMPAYTADYFSRVGFKSAYQGGFCNGQGDMYVPMTAKAYIRWSIHRDI